jgi:hypothetical protein
MKVGFPIADIEKTFKAFLTFITQPRNSFVINDSGELEVCGISGFRFWFYLTLFQVLLTLLVSGKESDYSIWFFITVMTYSVLRLALLSIIAYLTGLLFGFKNGKITVGFYFFLIAFTSTIVFLFSIPAIMEYGYLNNMIHQSEQILDRTNIPKPIIIAELLKLLIAVIITYIIAPIVLKPVLKTTLWKIVLWLLIIQIIYHLVFRESIIFVMSEMVEYGLENHFWEK